MSTLLQFSRNMRSTASRIENNSAKAVRVVARETLRALIDGTPVDEGVARSNWRASLVNPTSSVIPAYSPGKKLGIGERSNARAALAAGIAEINRLRVGPKTGQAGSAVFITNSIPYLGRLRGGSSTQQPNDWVEDAFLQARVALNGVRLLSRGGSE